MATFSLLPFSLSERKANTVTAVGIPSFEAVGWPFSISLCSYSANDHFQPIVHFCWLETAKSRNATASLSSFLHFDKPEAQIHLVTSIH